MTGGPVNTVFKMNPIDIIAQYYTPGSRSYDILLRHSESVAQKALRLAGRVTHLQPDIGFIEESALLHDIGIFYTDSPGIGCTGSYPYICHGYLGRGLLEAHGLTRHARVCERHVGVGLTAAEIIRFRLPIPIRDMLPETIEEKIVCIADKFFSKDPAADGERDPEEIVRMLEKYGQDKVVRFQSWLTLLDPDGMDAQPAETNPHRIGRM